MQHNCGAWDVQRRRLAAGRLVTRLAAGLWWWCLMSLTVADEPPQPYLEEPPYKMAPHLLGAPEGFRERLAEAGVTILADNTSFFITATSGFDTLFNDGMLLSAAVRVPTNWFGRPGHQLLGGTWNSRTYTSISEAYIPYPNVATPTIQGSWCLYWNFDQYLFVDPADETRGWGPFGRAGIADPNTSPIDAFLSFGVGGNVFDRTRRDDTFGIGWYYASTSPQIGTLITSQFGPIGNGQGIECFYNYELTPAVRITPDLQYVVPAIRSAEPALIAGVRALVSF
jgi:hypothetical protein